MSCLCNELLTTVASNEVRVCSPNFELFLITLIDAYPKGLCKSSINGRDLEILIKPHENLSIHNLISKLL